MDDAHSSSDTLKARPFWGRIADALSSVVPYHRLLMFLIGVAVSLILLAAVPSLSVLNNQIGFTAGDTKIISCAGSGTITSVNGTWLFFKDGVNITGGGEVYGMVNPTFVFRNVPYSEVYPGEFLISANSSGVLMVITFGSPTIPVGVWSQFWSVPLVETAPGSGLYEVTVIFGDSYEYPMELSENSHFYVDTFYPVVTGSIFNCVKASDETTVQKYQRLALWPTTAAIGLMLLWGLYLDRANYRKGLRQHLSKIPRSLTDLLFWSILPLLISAIMYGTLDSLNSVEQTQSFTVGTNSFVSCGGVGTLALSGGSYVPINPNYVYLFPDAVRLPTLQLKIGGTVDNATFQLQLVPPTFSITSAPYYSQYKTGLGFWGNSSGLGVVYAVQSPSDRSLGSKEQFYPISGFSVHDSFWFEDNPGSVDSSSAAASKNLQVTWYPTIQGSRGFTCIVLAPEQNFDKFTRMLVVPSLAGLFFVVYFNFFFELYRHYGANNAEQRKTRVLNLGHGYYLYFFTVIIIIAIYFSQAPLEVVTAGTSFTPDTYTNSLVSCLGSGKLLSTTGVFQDWIGLSNRLSNSLFIQVANDPLYNYSFNPPRIASNIEFNQKYSYSLYVFMLSSNDTVQFELYPGVNQTIPTLFFDWAVPDSVSQFSTNGYLDLNVNGEVGRISADSAYSWQQYYPFFSTGSGLSGGCLFVGSGGVLYDLRRAAVIPLVAYSAAVNLIPFILDRYKKWQAARKRKAAAGPVHMHTRVSSFDESSVNLSQAESSSKAALQAKYGSARPLSFV